MMWTIVTFLAFNSLLMLHNIARAAGSSGSEQFIRAFFMLGYAFSALYLGWFHT